MPIFFGYLLWWHMLWRWDDGKRERGEGYGGNECSI